MTAGLTDRFGRRARDLRLSVTDRCSLRCTYCMPEAGLPFVPRAELLTPEEIARLVGIGAGMLGVDQVRLTGGEPLVRPELVDIVRRARAAAPHAELSMTTNGIGLDRSAAALAEAGLDRVNISLDTLDRDTFRRLTRRDRLPRVLAGVRAALDAGLTPVKLNAVLLPHTLAEAPGMLRWAAETGCELRFIEQMPLGADPGWSRASVVTRARLLDALAREATLLPLGRPDDPSSPAETWLVDGGPATVGVIAPVSGGFCARCDRTRITATGAVLSCLFDDRATDLRALLRSGAGDEEIADRWRAAMLLKPAGNGMAAAGFTRPARSMSQIGG